MNRLRASQWSALILSLVPLTGCPGGAGLVGGSCPSDSVSFSRMNAATYAVVLQVRTGPGPNDVGFITLGTAFAVDQRLLATNAHVTEFFNGLTGLNVERVVGVQSGTGTVVTLLRALTHPDYTGNPVSSPDVGLFTTLELLPTVLPIAPDDEIGELQLGSDLLLAGFPGDVQDLFAITPGVTVPQATSLSGEITAFRNHDAAAVVTPSTTDVIQHQIPTTPGTSGSALVKCGKVVGVHNAGTVQIVIVVGDDGQLMEDRTAAASNNFGVHAKYMREMISLFNDQSLQGFELPPPFIPGGGGGGNGPAAAFAGTYQGGVTAPANAAHQLNFTINGDGTVTGTSTWANTGNFTLTGTIDAQGNITFTDDAQRIGFNQGLYTGTVNPQTGQATGTYAEGNAANVLANWSVMR